VNPITRRTALLTALAAGSALVSGCSASGSVDVAVQPAAASGPTGAGIFDRAHIQSVALEVDPAYTAMIATYRSSGEKDWMHAAATINGRRFEEVGLRLKGNLTLREVTASTDPAAVPFLLKLDKYVDGQDVDGWTELAIRSSTSTTALTEAVALDLLGVAGLATQLAVSTRISVNGGAPKLRLVVQNPDSTWEASQFDGTGLLYKAEAGGDYSYRGTDPAAYADAFDQETGKDDLTPLIGLLAFLNTSSDAAFVQGLAKHLDVTSFARYLAFEELVGNRDDIEGGGNNSYLRVDSATGRFTVVAWDHNSATP
jgi:spore coat protein CotH